MQHDLDVTLDELVKSLREKAGIRSQEELAQRAGVSASMIGHIEAGSRSVSPANLRRIADALGASTKDRGRLARARDRTSERLASRKTPSPTDLGPRPRPANHGTAEASTERDLEAEVSRLRADVDGFFARRADQMSWLVESLAMLAELNGVELPPPPAERPATAEAADTSSPARRTGRNVADKRRPRATRS